MRARSIILFRRLLWPEKVEEEKVDLSPLAQVANAFARPVVKRFRTRQVHPAMSGNAPSVAQSLPENEA